jgi:hypothetical protein
VAPSAELISVEVVAALPNCLMAIVEEMEWV